MLSLEPAAMRGPDDFVATPQISVNGGNLARTLYELATRRAEVAGEAEVERTYAEVATRLRALIGARAVRVARDDQRQTLTLEVLDEGGAYIPARSLSDGTLRFLVLCVMRIDPDVQGLLCMEEPENGIHPERIAAMAELVHGLAVDPQRTPGADNPMRQVTPAAPSLSTSRSLDRRSCGVRLTSRGVPVASQRSDLSIRLSSDL